jgi:hypothetical protein
VCILCRSAAAEVKREALGKATDALETIKARVAETEARVEAKRRAVRERMEAAAAAVAQIERCAEVAKGASAVCA